VGFLPFFNYSDRAACGINGSKLICGVRFGYLNLFFHKGKKIISTIRRIRSPHH
jgi:hypothetical protein